MIASVAGAVVKPMPTPITIIWPAISRYEVATLAVETQVKPMADHGQAGGDDDLVADAHRQVEPRVIEPTTMEIATGRTRSPVLKGE